MHISFFNIPASLLIHFILSNIILIIKYTFISYSAFERATFVFYKLIVKSFENIISLFIGKDDDENEGTTKIEFFKIFFILERNNIKGIGTNSIKKKIRGVHL
jgi:hypothetical protein